MHDTKKSSDTAIRLQEIIENQQDALYKRNLLTDSYDYLSPVFEQISGYTPEEMKAMPIKEILTLIHRADLPEIKSAIADSKSGEPGSTYHLEYRFRHKNGQYIWLQDRFTTLCDLEGKVEAWIGYVSDITERKWQEKKLCETENHFAIIADSVYDTIWNWGLQSKCVLWNDTIQKSFCHDKLQTQPVASWWIQRIHPGDRQQVIDSLKNAMRSQKRHWAGKYRLERADGTYTSILDRVSVFYDNKGRPIRIIGVGIDLTLIINLEKQQHQTEANFHFLAEASPSGIWRTDHEGNNTYVSKRWSEITGIFEKDAIGDGWSSRIHPEDRELIRKGWYETTQKKTHYESEFRFVQPGGNVVWVLCTAVQVHNEQGDTAEWIGTISNITRLKQQESSLKNTTELLKLKLSAIKTLEGILPICSHCRKIRSNNGAWFPIEAYIAKKTNVDFSHGICPECAERHYPDYDLYKK